MPEQLQRHQTLQKNPNYIAENPAHSAGVAVGQLLEIVEAGLVSIEKNTCQLYNCLV